MTAQAVLYPDSAFECPPVVVGDFSLRAEKHPPLRVLVVDDEPLVRWSVAETLRAPEYEVIEAGSGNSAIYALMNAPAAIDVVLLDLVLPDYRDLSLLAVLRRMVPTLPIVMMTAFATPELVERARALGAFAVVNKPFEMNDLAPVLRLALQAARTPSCPTAEA
jgi:two-component system, NtrC family, response regulator AtoC